MIVHTRVNNDSSILPLLKELRILQTDFRKKIEKVELSNKHYREIFNREIFNNDLASKVIYPCTNKTLLLSGFIGWVKGYPMEPPIMSEALVPDEIKSKHELRYSTIYIEDESTK